jgi:hypothetical protein
MVSNSTRFTNEGLVWLIQKTPAMAGKAHFEKLAFLSLQEQRRARWYIFQVANFIYFLGSFHWLGWFPDSDISMGNTPHC